jgi:hypothetical protein
MEIAYIKPDGSLTYEGMNLWQEALDSIDAAASSLDGLSDVAITTPATGQALVYDGTNWVNSAAGMRVLLATRTASASATLDFTEFNNAVYRRYEFELENLLPATDAVGLVMRFSTDGGATYDATAGDYSHARTQKILATAEDDTGGSGSATNIVLATNIGTAAGEQGVTGILRLWSAGSAVRTTARWDLHTFDAGAGGINMISGVGARLANQDTDAVRFLQGAGNITSGTIRMFGIV